MLYSEGNVEISQKMDLPNFLQAISDIDKDRIAISCTEGESKYEVLL